MGRFRDALSAPGLSAIAEVKRRSPSSGDLRPDADPAALAAEFERSGAAAVSILVDEQFAGSVDDLRAARATTGLPLLAKGFFSTRAELGELREAGADAVLLLLRDLDDPAMLELLRATRELELDALVEAHDAEELERAVRLDAETIGINARDLTTFEIDRRAQLALVAKAPRDRVVVAESGIASRAQGAAAELAGADAILVGSALMRASDPPGTLAKLISRPLVKVCGLTREEDVAAAAEAGADLAGFIRVDGSPRRADGVLPVPDDAALGLRPRGRAARRRRRPRPALRPRRQRPAPRTRRIAAPGRRARRAGSRPSLGGGRPGPPRPSRSGRRACGARRAARPRQRPRRDRRRAPVGSRCRVETRIGAGNQGPRQGARLRGGRTVLTYGAYGGRFVPETLIPALDELEQAWNEAREDPAFALELDELGRVFGGRPTPLMRAERFAPDKRLYLKREDLLHTGAHKLNNALGQAVLARRLGKRRIVAETGAGQHGVAAATVCAKFGLDCVVYMGAEDMAPPAAQRRADAPARRGGRARRVRHEDPARGDERGDPRLDRERRDDALPARLLRRSASVSRARS